MSGGHFRAVCFGVETLLPGQAVRARHRHGAGYATVVLGGSFVEAGFAGRSIVLPGEVLLHAALDCHANLPLTRRRIQILRLPWPNDGPEGHFRIEDPDELVRLSEHDPHEAARVLATVLGELPAQQLHWTEVLAAALAQGSPLTLNRWAEVRGLRPEDVSRGFGRDFGVSPKRFRLEARTRRAWQAVLRGERTLTRIAHDHEFADLAHMSRSIRAFTGHAPTRWRLRLARSRPAQVRSS
jgi:AraC-like DNA-binding protein